MSGERLRIERADPRADEARALVAAAEAHLLRLYPPEECFGVSSDELADADAMFFLARLDGKAVGCAALWIEPDGSGELKRMFVDEAARGQGIGVALLHAVETEALVRGVPALRLETGRDSQAALALYRRAGFEERGVFGGYVAGKTNMFMEKTIGRAAA